MMLSVKLIIRPVTFLGASCYSSFHGLVSDSFNRCNEFCQWSTELLFDRVNGRSVATNGALPLLFLGWVFWKFWFYGCGRQFWNFRRVVTRNAEAFVDGVARTIEKTVPNEIGNEMSNFRFAAFSDVCTE